MLKSLVAILMALAIAASLAPVHAQTSTPPDPLMAMLAFIPDSPVAFPDNGLGPSYVDYKTIITTRGVTQPANSAAFKALDQDARQLYISALSRINTGPDLLSYAIQYISGMEQVVGFDWFAIARVATFGTPPDTGLVLAGDFDQEKIAAALKARDFQLKPLDGVPVWYRFEDAAVNVKVMEPRDPFGGQLGLAARVALFPGYIANARAWPLITDIIGANNKQSQSLAGNPDYQAVSAALTDPNFYKGPLLQVQFAKGAAFDVGNNVTLATRGMPNPPDLKQYGELPPYTLVALADRQEGDMQVNLIALLYPDAGTAQQASVELQKRIKDFDVAKQYAAWQVVIDDPHVYKTTTGAAVAVVSVRYPQPPITPDAQTKQVARPGQIFRLWMGSIYRRQFFPLAVKVPDAVK